MPRNSTNITVTLFDRDKQEWSTTIVSHRKLYDSRSDVEIKQAEHWAKQVCNRIYGK